MRKDGTEVPIDDSGAPIRDPDGKIMGVVLVFRDITERKKTEKALRESEAKANALIKYAPTGIYEIDYRGPSFISVNDAMCQILGYTREELFSIGPSGLLDDNSRARFADRIRRQLAGEKVEESVEFRVGKKDGSFIDAILNVTLNVAGENPGRALVVAHDITARKRAEEALRESEVKYRNLFENMAEEVHFWRLVRDEEERIKTWRLVDANPPTLKTWGKKLEEIKGKTTDEIFGPGATGHYMPVVQKIMTEGVPHSFEDYLPNLDKYFRFTSVPLGEYFITTGADITNLKKANEALRASEQKFSTLYSSMTEGVAQHEVIYKTAGQPTDYIILDVNPAYETITGLSKDKIIGKKGSDIYGTGEAPYLDLYSRVASSGQAESFETYFPPMKKHFHISAFSPGKGKFATVFQDITERKQSEEELQTTLQRFYTVLSNMYASILLVGDDGRIEFANQAFCDFFDLKDSPADLTGLTSPEMIGKIKDGYLHPNEEITRIREIVGRGQPVKGEEIAMRGGRTCLRDFIPLYVDGKSYGRLWIHVEITERKQAEEALRERERLLQDVIDGSTSPIFLKDRDGKFITINASLERMLGMSREEIKGKTDYDIAPKEVADYWRTHDTKVMATGKAIQIEEVADLQDGHHIFLANKFPLVDADGQVYGVGAISHDITERKRMEEELRSLAMS